MSLTVSQIRGVDTGAAEKVCVEVPQWGGSVWVRRLTVIEQEHWWDILDDARKGINAPAGRRGSVVLMATINQAGEPVFGLDDAAWLGAEADVNAVNSVYEAIMKLSGLMAEEQRDIEKKPETSMSSSSAGSQTAGESGMSTD